MAGPHWEIEYSDEFRAAQKKYKKTIDGHVVFSANSVDFKRRRNHEEAIDKRDAFSSFLEDLKRHGEKHRDPNTLPPARDEDKEEITGFYCFQRDGWCAYLYRDDSDEKHKCTRAILLISESDRPINLRAALRHARNLE
jgi:hypothetical protein